MSDARIYRTEETKKHSLLDKSESTIVDTTFDKDGDDLMEAILDNLNNTPIGRVLKRISELPEIRRGKVLELRKQLTEGKYELSDRLDYALDRVLEDLMV